MRPATATCSQLFLGDESWVQGFPIDNSRFSRNQNGQPPGPFCRRISPCMHRSLLDYDITRVFQMILCSILSYQDDFPRDFTYNTFRDDDSVIARRVLTQNVIVQRRCAVLPRTISVERMGVLETNHTIGVVAPGASSVDLRLDPFGWTSPKLVGSIFRIAPSSLQPCR